MMAAMCGQAQCVEIPLAAGANPSLCAPKGRHAGMWAVSHGHPDCLRLILGAGVDLDAQESSHGITMAMLAATRNDHASLQLLIDAGADLQKLNQSGQTALMIAEEFGADDCLRLLTLREGAMLEKASLHESMANALAPKSSRPTGL